jgi:hypothetical protein
MSSLPRTYLMSTLACPSASWCAATSHEANLELRGVLLTSADPSNAGAWTSTPLPFADVSCPTATFCAGSDYLGAIHISGNPSGGASAWSSQQLGIPPQCSGSVHQYCNYDSLDAVSCPSISFCATTDGVDLWTSTDPSTPGAGWSKSPLPKLHNDGYQRVYCPTQSLCLAGSKARLETTSDPADPSPQWTAANLPKVVLPPSPNSGVAPSISGVSCVSAQLCVAVEGGYAFVGNPSDPNSWTATKIDYSSPPPAFADADSLTGVSCTPSGRCVAIDGSGNVIVGTTSG